MRSIVVALLLLLVPASGLFAQQNWPAFRGGELAGLGTDKALPVEWSATKNVVWKADVPGRGWSSPVVWGDRVLLTTVVSDKEPLAARKGLYIQDLQGKIPPGEHRWMVLCLDRKTGKTLWQAEAHRGKPAATIHIKNTYASETPVTDGERVYAYFGNVGLFCYDMDGKALWKHSWPTYKMKMGWGTAASPAVHDGMVYVVNDNEEKSFLAALDAKTGKVLWEVARDEKSTWATPFVWVNSARTEIVVAGTKRVRSYSTKGDLLWELGNNSIIAIPTPFARGDLLYVTSGYVLDPFHKPVYAIRPGATGDITLKAGEMSNRWIAWCQRGAGPYHPSPLVMGDYCYVLLDRGMLSCFNAKTGELVYDRERLGASAFTASPWGYNDRIFCLSEDGDTVVVQAGAEFKVLGKNALEEMTLASPAISGKSLFIRTQTRLYRIEQAP